MPITFNLILRQAGIRPEDVSLLRHQDKRAERGRTPYDLWLKKNGDFEFYQSHQRKEARRKFARPIWASFLGTPSNETVFAGLYSAKLLGPLEHDVQMPHRDGIEKAGSCDTYKLTLWKELADLTGRLVVEWGRRPAAPLARTSR